MTFCHMWLQQIVSYTSSVIAKKQLVLWYWKIKGLTCDGPVQLSWVADLATLTANAAPQFDFHS